MQKMLDYHYAQRGWDTNGLPTRETLEWLELTGLSG
jgi:aldehyde:ferredoxin oxidoreductase